MAAPIKNAIFGVFIIQNARAVSPHHAKEAFFTARAFCQTSRASFAPHARSRPNGRVKRGRAAMSVVSARTYGNGCCDYGGNQTNAPQRATAVSTSIPRQGQNFYQRLKSVPMPLLDIGTLFRHHLQRWRLMLLHLRRQ